ncbi:MAG: OmpA family protein [Bacteroidales bacterium]|nr:OmpA family protein [Bacteroidales bacterium]
MLPFARLLRTLPLLLCLSLPLFVQAQTPEAVYVPPDAEFPFRRDMEKGKYDKAEEKIRRRISRDSNNLECHYAAYWLYSAADFARRNLDTAYIHLVRVRNLYAKADEKELERWARDSYSGARIDYDLYRLALLAIADAHRVRTPDAYQHILDYYPLFPHEMQDSAVNSRDSLEFDIARRSGTIQTLQDFIDRRPNARVLKDAIVMRDSMAFAQADAQHTYTAYQHFRVAYPHSHLYDRATDSVYLLDYRDVLLHNTEQYYRGYADRYPASPYSARCLWLADSIEYHREVDTARWESLISYLDNRHRPNWRDTAVQSLTLFALRHGHLPAALQAAKHTTGSNPYRDDLGKMLHQFYIHTSIRNFDRFYHSHLAALVPPRQREADSIAHNLYLNYNYSIIDSCIRTIAPYHEAYLMLQQLVKDDIDHRRWNNALSTLGRYAEHFADDYDYLQLVATLEAKADPTIKASALGTSINSVKGEEYAPVVSADERTLFFAAKNRPENIGGEDVFVSHRNGSNWSPATIVMELSHTYGNEAPVAISVDGNSLLLYQSGNLYRADRTQGDWHINKLPTSINASSWQSDAMLAPNGRALLFAAKGHTVHEADSSLNLYVSLLDEKGRWSDPIELGNSVNTPFDERSPFLHSDMRTLYFSSEGHGSLGQMDVYMTTRLDESWIHWSQPVNIGKEVNTTGDDWGYKITTDGRKAYFSRRVGSTQDIYTTPLPQRARPQPVTTVTGTVKDSHGSPIATQLNWESLTTAQPLGQCRSNPENGSFTLILPQGDTYGIYVSDNQHFPTSYTIDLQGSDIPQKSTIDLTLHTLQEIVEDSLAILLHNVTFAPSNPQPSTNSYPELLRVANLIRQHGYRATVECYVDGNPGDADNLTLTNQRANAILNFLIDHGCRPSNLTATGYGSNRPLPNRKGDRTRQQQRRTVLRLY